MEEKLSTVHFNVLENRSPGRIVLKQKQQKRYLEALWRSLDVQRDHSLKHLTPDESLVRSMQRLREDHMATIESHLSEPQIAEIEGENGERHHSKQVTRAKNTAGDSTDEVHGRLKPLHRPVKFNLSNTGRSKSFHGRDYASSRKAETIGKRQHSWHQLVPSYKHEPKRGTKNGKTSQSAPRLREKSNELIKDRGNDSMVFATQDLSKANKSVTLPKNSDNLNMADLRATLPVINSQRRASSPSILLWSRSQTPSRMSKLNATGTTQDASDPLKRERTRAELRDIMIIETNLHYKNLLRRKEALMSNIDDMVTRDRCLAEGRPLPPPPPKKVQLTTMSQGRLLESVYNSSNINDVRKEIRRRKKDRMREWMQTELPSDQFKQKNNETDDDYADRLEKLWKEMRKVRYLRLGSNTDLSEFVTLASEEQVKKSVWDRSLRDNLL